MNQFPDLNGEAGTQQLQENGPENGNGNGNGLLGDSGLNIDRNLVIICANINLNGQFSGDRLPPILEE